MAVAIGLNLGSLGRPGANWCWTTVTVYDIIGEHIEETVHLRYRCMAREKGLSQVLPTRGSQALTTVNNFSIFCLRFCLPFAYTWSKLAKQVILVQRFGIMEAY